jgi:soluble lytic murein transglycosylase-like protein
MRLMPPGRRACTVLLGAVTLISAPSLLHAEYVVLRNGQRLSVTGYELQNGTYRLQLKGGSVELPAGEVMKIEPEDVFMPVLPPVAVSDAPYEQMIRNAAARNRVDADLIASVIAAESNFNPRAVSRKNARGLMQLLPETARKLGVRNSFDPRENIEAGTRYLSSLLQLYKNNLALALAAYNAGPQRVNQYRAVPPYQETVAYVNRVSRSYAKRKTSHESVNRQNGDAVQAQVSRSAGL